MGSDAGFEGCAGYGGLISIHAPRMGSDRFGRRHRPVGGHFNPRSPDGERQNRKRRSNQMKDFNPRSPDGERHGLPCGEVASRFISIHTPRMGSDLWTSTWRCPSNHFNPRSPDGERPSPQYRSFRPAAISIHAPRMGSDCKLPGSGGACTISIHAPRMGSDYCGITCTSRRAYFNPRSPDGERLIKKLEPASLGKFQSTLPGWGATFGGAAGAFHGHISIHAPRMGSDWNARAGNCTPPRFQSTLPGWGATRRPFRSVWRRNFNPRSPDGERQDAVDATTAEQSISIHAPRMGSDAPFEHLHGRRSISIHAPRMGSDFPMSTISSIVCDFNPRSPDGERPAYRMRFEVHPNDFNPRSPDGERPSSSSLVPVLWDFNPRSPDGERLADPLARLAFRGISIHAPRMGSDRGQRRHRPHRPDFNPRSPDGERPRAPRCSTRTSRYFNPRSPDGERRLRHRNTMVTEKFQSTLPGWGATESWFEGDGLCSFQSTLPGWGATRAVVRAVPKVAISIHAPRMGSDHDGVPDHVPSGLISIHAPRMGSDPMRRGYGLGCWNFNPRSPDGERRMLVPASSMVTVFQSTLPGWGATWSVYVPIWYTLFQSTLPGWGATATAVGLRVPAGISIHAPRMGSDPSRLDNNTVQVKFQSTLPGWGATAPLPTAPTRSANFNPRSPGGERL